MKIEIIKNSDKDLFKQDVEKLYKTAKVKNVFYDTQVIDNEIKYIAIIEYKDNVNGTLEDLHLSGRSYNALRRNNINTIEELNEAMLSGKIRHLRNLGIVSLKEIEDKLNY